MVAGRACGARSVALAGAAGVGVALARKRCLRWGATDEEVSASLPGDEFVSPADIAATRAVTVGVAPDLLWPWIAQLGQGRGGFYTYDFLENLAGCDMHSAGEVVPEWQSIAVGDEVRLHPEVALRVALVEPGRALVLRGGVPMGGMPPPYDFTWAFVVRGEQGGPARLVVRERYRYTKRWSAVLVEPLQFISFVMSRAMLRGIRQRAERAVASTA